MKKVSATMVGLVTVLVTTFLALAMPSQEDMAVEVGREVVQEIETQVTDARGQSTFRSIHCVLELVALALLLDVLLLVVKALSSFLNAVGEL